MNLSLLPLCIYILCCLSMMMPTTSLYSPPGPPVHKMPPRVRGRGRGQGAYATSHDHEAGPSHRRTPSGPQNTDARNLWRSFAEPARHSASLSTSPSIPHSFGPHSENEPHNSHQSYIPLQNH
ncbi:hypothetical protein Hanom_Chr07g00653001 [Helianthus anomalus]